MPEVGDTLGRYTLLRRLAVGGMGEVFVAAKPGPVGFGPYVALKVLRDELACDQQFVDMLVDEANISMFLNHQNVVSVLDLGTSDNTYYIAMEYVQGITVERLVDSVVARGKKLPIPVGLYIGMELCRSLKYAHTRVNHSGEPLNIVHRDVTPANLLLSTQGEVKLTDFGIARAKGRVHQTQAGVLKGKFGYMAPEMVRYERIDARADLFCTGVCLYLMLGGQHPVAGAAVMEAIQRFEDKRIPPPSSLNPEITPELDTIVMRCLEPQVNNRWATAAALGDALQDAMLRNAAWRSAGNDGARLIAQQIRQVAPEAFDAPVSAEQSRHLLARARADQNRDANDAALSDALGQDRLQSLRARIPTDPSPVAVEEPATEDNEPLRAEELIELPTATSLPAISPESDFGETPGIANELETDEQLSLQAVERARAALTRDTDTDEQNSEPTDDSLPALDDSEGAVPSAPADATLSTPVVGGSAREVGFTDSSTDRNKLHAQMIDEPSLPDVGAQGYNAPPGVELADRTVAQYEYEEGAIDRPLGPSGGDDATMVSFNAEDALDAEPVRPGAELGPPMPSSARDDATVAGVSVPDFDAGPDTAWSPPPAAASGGEDAPTIIPPGPEADLALDTSDWKPAPDEDDAADATLLDGLDASDVMAAVQAAKSRASTEAEIAPAPARLDSEAIQELVNDAVAPTAASPAVDPALVAPQAGSLRIEPDRPPGAVGPGDIAQPPIVAGAPVPGPSRSPVPTDMPPPSVSPIPEMSMPPPISSGGLAAEPPGALGADHAEASAHGPESYGSPQQGPSVGDSTGRWMAGELGAEALAWDDDAAARRAVFTRNQPVGNGPSTPPQAIALPGVPPDVVAPPIQPSFLARNGMPLLAGLLAVLLVGGLGYTWFFTRVFWPTLRLDSNPTGSQVLVNGQQMPGLTPLQIKLEPGKAHTIEVRHDGYRSKTQQITEEVTQLKRYRLTAVLSRLARQVLLPTEGTVFVNGKAVATGKAVQLPDLGADGPVTLRVEAKGYRAYEATFADPDEIPESLDVPLSKM